MRTIFIGGIHGAGKTHLSERLSQELGIKHYSAGQLLSDRLPKRKGTALRHAETLESDQLFVIQRLRELANPLEYVVLDGHFALATEGAGVVPIPKEYFELLEPVALLLLDTPVNEVRRRLTVRDGHAPLVSLIQELRSQELATAYRVSQELSVPLCVLSGSDAFLQASTFISSAID